MLSKGRTHRKGFRRHKVRNPNHIPVNIASGFESEFRDLIDSLDCSFGFKGDYLKTEIFSKYLDPNVVSPKQRETAAIQKWLATEQRNEVTNVRLMTNEPGSDDSGFGWVKYDTFTQKVRDIISDILGPLDYPNCLCWGGHSSGASTRLNRSPENFVKKFTGQAHITEDAIKHWLAYASGTRLSKQDLTIVSSSELFTVPKSSSIDRVACKEPDINMFLQRSIGSVIRNRLRRVGIDLNDQTINQRLAKQGSISGSLATVDLSSASDSISHQLVTELLPFDWSSLLNDLRVKQTLIKDEVHTLSMFSSMGNGFTFELESLIFLALTRAVCYFSHVKGTISVYGDDIICPSAIVPRLARVFSWYGFIVNSKKSHWVGSFRESCGKHYHNGYDVSPFYLRERVGTKSDIIRVLNQLMWWDARDTGFIVDSSILSFHYRWSKALPSCLHGGQDPESIYSLVTGSPPRKRLASNSVDIPMDDVARLSAWFVGTQQRSQRNMFNSHALCITASRDGRWKTIDEAEWTIRTNMKPWLLLATVHL